MIARRVFEVYPVGAGKAAILPTIAPDSRRIRRLSACAQSWLTLSRQIAMAVGQQGTR